MAGNLVTEHHTIVETSSKFKPNPIVGTSELESSSPITNKKRHLRQHHGHTQDKTGRPLLRSHFGTFAVTTHVSTLVGALVAYPLEKVTYRRSIDKDTVSLVTRMNMNHNGYETRLNETSTRLRNEYNNKNMFSILKNIYRNEGGIINGLYRGFSSRIIRITMTTMPMLLFDEIFRTKFVDSIQLFDINGELKASMISGILSSLIHYPFDKRRLFIQTQFAIDNNNNNNTSKNGTRLFKLTGSNDNLNKLRQKMFNFNIVKEYFTMNHPVSLYYKGVSRTIMFNCLYSTVLFTSFAYLKSIDSINKNLGIEKNNWYSDAVNSSIACFMAIASTTTCRSISLPLLYGCNLLPDNLRTKEMSQKGFGEQYWDSFKYLMRNGIVSKTVIQLPVISISLCFMEFHKQKSLLHDDN